MAAEAFDCSLKQHEPLAPDAMDWGGGGWADIPKLMFWNPKPHNVSIWRQTSIEVVKARYRHELGPVSIILGVYTHTEAQRAHTFSLFTGAEIEPGCKTVRRWPPTTKEGLFTTAQHCQDWI